MVVMGGRGKGASDDVVLCAFYSCWRDRGYVCGVAWWCGVECVAVASGDR